MSPVTLFIPSLSETVRCGQVRRMNAASEPKDQHDVLVTEVGVTECTYGGRWRIETSRLAAWPLVSEPVVLDYLHPVTP